MWTYNYPDELYHHGIKGQKWGVRRYQNPDGSRTAAGKKRRKLKADINENQKFVNGRYKKVGYDDWSDDAKSAYSLKQKNINEMSNAELRELNNRMQLERQYNELNPSTVSKGYRAVKEASSVVGTAIGVINTSKNFAGIIGNGKSVIETSLAKHGIGDATATMDFDYYRQIYSN